MLAIEASIPMIDSIDGFEKDLLVMERVDVIVLQHVVN
jgi:hypothetical protein